ncbi:DUF551 domain-containing protein [Klebsiella pneumoniae]|uniref:DUF551 domain-containing protein n=1 Tax=Klebsiella pneumoniae TaxID=573 RepID=UPI001D0B852B|nr:DUF551 domain-containing protein [Klebsiella pneumoniae]
MTSKLTKERLLEIAEDGFLKHGESKELARMALAAMDSEPVESGEYGDAYQGAREDLAIWKRRALEAEEGVRRLEQINDHLVKEAQGESRMGEPVIAQPAPVVPDAYVRDERGRMMLNGVCEPKIGFGIGWNACRAAMLDRQLVDHVDEESLTSINPAPAMGSLSKTGEVLHTNSPAQGGNSSVIPDTWIPVSEQMPPSRHEVLVGRWWGEKPRWCCKWATYIPGHPDAQSSGWLIPGGSWTPTHWMELPAAPQEVR